MKRALLIISLLFLFIVPSVRAESTFNVLKVVDGDTIQVDVRGKKEVVRLLAIDTPETVDPRKPVQCFGKAASDKMKSFVSGKSVILVDDSSQGNRDKYGRLLRFVYLSDSVRTFVNGEMVKQGFAYSYRQYPTKFLSRFNAWETYAREHSLGLWGSCQLKITPTVKPRATTVKTVVPTRVVTVIPLQPIQTNTVQTVPDTNTGFSCAGKTTCGQMTSCAEARYYLTTCGVSRLDGDKDGTPCETICR